MRTTFLALAAVSILAGCASVACERAALVEQAAYAKKVEEGKEKESRTEEFRQEVVPKAAMPEKKVREDGFLLSPSEYAEVWLESAKPDLGAYHVELQYDPKIIEVESIEAAASRTQTLNPISKPQTFRTGRTGIVGIAPGGAKVEGRVVIARVRFRPVAEGTSSLGVSLRGIKDSLANDVAGTSGIEPQQITVTKQ
jgi:hypothetical protein